MARPEKFDNPWAANGGDITPAPSDAKRDVGFVGGDRPYLEYFNLNYKEEQEAINGIIDEGPSSFYNDASDVSGMIATGLWDESWGITTDASNQITGGATKSYADICTYFTTDKEPRVLLLDRSLDKIEVWNPRTRALVDTSHDLTGDLPSGGGSEDWAPISMVSDNTTVYAVFGDDNEAVTVYRLQAWDLATWNVKTGWPATGTATAPNDSGGTVYYRRVIIADGSSLAVLNRIKAISGSSSAAINIVSMADGTITATGAGDCATANSPESASVICSDGTNLYFICSETAGTYNRYICTATIADPTAGIGSPWPLTTEAGSGTTPVQALTSCGPDMIISSSQVTSSESVTDEIIRTHTADDTILDRILRGQNAAGTPITNQTWMFEKAYQSLFDGVNLWILARINNGSGNLALVKIATAKLSLQNQSSYRDLSDVTQSVFIVGPAHTLANDGENTRMTYDGRDIWVILEPTASTTNSGNIFRLPRALLQQ